MKNHRLGGGRLLMAAIACGTLGLAPYTPEPHLVGKIRWLVGGGDGMSGRDYFDLILHGAPWIWLIVEVARFMTARRNMKAGPSR